MEVTNSYIDAIKAIKQAILQSRYRAATLANREMLMLYFGIGEYISKNSRDGFWGTNAIAVISEQLQKELPGLRGFSETNMKRMRLFYENWVNEICPLPTNDLQNIDNNSIINRPPMVDDLGASKNGIVINHSLTAGNLEASDLECFVRVSFTHHYEIIAKAKDLKERLFYIKKCATEFWSKEKLNYNLKSNLYQQQGALPNNFAKTITNKDLRAAALCSFKDELFLDYINIEDPDEADEREIENEIVRNIRKFIMTLGTDFSFIGNQYRILLGKEEFFIDLLFFNRKVQSLVAIELKRGKFKAEYLGKMNLYLSALDEYVKQPHENPSIGIILCKEKDNTVVEFAFRDFSKPMGVAIFKTASELPEKYKNILPDAESFKHVLDRENE